MLFRPDSSRSAIFACVALSLLGMIGWWPAERAAAQASSHWAFQPLRQVALPNLGSAEQALTAVDAFINARLAERGLWPGPPADRAALLRRVTLGLVGRPPTPQELSAFLSDTSHLAYERTVERLLASPQYGERWGKYWLDAAGYADSNGYFNADSDRPWAYRYRDYVITAWNRDKSYDRFVREQLAGDELAQLEFPDAMDPRAIELLTATHFLRNAQDGTGESDGNPDELTVDRATVLEGAVQVTLNCMLGLTIQCARCHEHKFEPIEHAEYYQLEAVFYPAFPAFHPEHWIKPQQRLRDAVPQDVVREWEEEQRRLDQEILNVQRGLTDWAHATRPPGALLFADDFDTRPEGLHKGWSDTAPGDDAAGGAMPVDLDGQRRPAANIADGCLWILEGGDPGNRWLSTTDAFDWTPNQTGDWIQVTFDLIKDRSQTDEKPAERIGFYLAAHDFQDNGAVAGGNILIDGNPAGGAAVHVDYPGDDARAAGHIGVSGFTPGRNYGARITNGGDATFRLQLLVDGMPQDNELSLPAAELADGGFAFEYCCGRSFVVDNVRVEASPPPTNTAYAQAQRAFEAALQQKREQVQQVIASVEARRSPRPGKLAWVNDSMLPPPAVHRLERGSYSDPDEVVPPGGLSVLGWGPQWNVDSSWPTSSVITSTGRRLALARWLTDDQSPAAALLARVLVNRLWQHHFGRGLVSTPDNLGQSGDPPSHRDLLDFLATELVRTGWSIKTLQRLIVTSAVYQQSSQASPQSLERDPENQWWSRFPVLRLDAEAVRDSMLAVAGELNGRMFGPYVPTQRQDDGDVVLDPKHPGARRRGIYLQQRRTQLNSLLSLFDAPQMAVTCGRRSSSTVPLQSLALLNSDFARDCSAAMASRLFDPPPANSGTRLREAFRLAFGREPSAQESAAAQDFLHRQTELEPAAGARSAWIDLCQMLLASNAFLYVD